MCKSMSFMIVCKGEVDRTKAVLHTVMMGKVEEVQQIVEVKRKEELKTKNQLCYSYIGINTGCKTQKKPHYLKLKVTKSC